MAADEVQGAIGVIYGRYSAGPTQTDQSLEGQLRDCYAYARHHGIKIIHEYLDRHISGKEAESRPEFQQMITDSKRKRFNVVLVWKLDRFARNRYDSARYKTAMKKNGVRVISVMEPISEGPEGIILESVLEGFAEYFSADLSQKVKRGMLESAHKCRCMGLPPIGYKVGPNREFLIDEEKAPYVQRIFRMYVSGEPNRKIIDEVNAMGCRSSRGKPLAYTNVPKIISCEKYIGVYESQGVRVENAIPPIITPDLWLAAQERLRASAVGAYTYKNNGANAKQCYLLAGKVFCGECGAPMVGETSLKTFPDGSTLRRSYYTCARRKCNKRSERRKPLSERCPKKLVRKEALEELVKDRTRFFLKRPDVLEAIRKACQEIEANQITRESEVKAIRSQMKRNQTRIDNILKAIEEGVYTPSVTERLKSLEAEQFQLKLNWSRGTLRTGCRSRCNGS